MKTHTKLARIWSLADPRHRREEQVHGIDCLWPLFERLERDPCAHGVADQDHLDLLARVRGADGVEQLHLLCDLVCETRGALRGRMAAVRDAEGGEAALQ